MVDGIRRYYECEAFLRGDPGICGKLARYQKWEVYGDKIKTENRQRDFEVYCRSLNNNLIVIRLNVTGRKDAAKICAALPFTEEELGDRSVEDECQWMTEPTPDPQCQGAISPALGVLEIEDCVSHFVFHADEKTCPLIDGAPLSPGARSVYRKQCDEVALYRKAHKAKDVRRCGASLGCRMLMGENVCSRHLEGFREEYCRWQTAR
jgi:hypothetical protein